MSGASGPSRIRPASRTQAVSEYYFAGKLEKLRKMRASGVDVISLGIGAPDGVPPAAALDAARAALGDPLAHRYATHRGTPELRRAMADWYARTFAVSLDADREILPLLGSKEGVFYLSLALLEPGDAVLVPDPGYAAYASAARLAGARVIPYVLEASKGWKPDFEAIAKQDLSGVRMMWANYPHMPTGASPTPRLFEELVAFGRRHGILVCHDNPYALILNSTAPLSLLAFDPGREHVVELNSLSKSHQMSGWRVGMIAGRPDVIDWVLRVKSNVDSGMFPVVQEAAREALVSSGPEWFNDLNHEYARKQRATCALFDRLGFRYALPQSGLFVWAEAPSEVADVEKYLDRLLDATGVFLVPGKVFGTSSGRYARASICAPVERIEEAAKRVEKWAHEGGRA